MLPEWLVVVERHSHHAFKQLRQLENAKNLYEVLGVPPSASPLAIRKSPRHLQGGFVWVPHGAPFHPMAQWLILILPNKTAILGVHTYHIFRHSQSQPCV
jgi:hypothetical protein